MTNAIFGAQLKEFRIMKYISIVFVIFLASCGGSSDNPFAPLTSSDAPVAEQIPTQAPVAPSEPSSTTPIQTPVPVVDVVPEPQPEPDIIPEPEPEPVIELAEQPDPAPPVEPAPVPVSVLTPEAEIEGIWHCKQFGESFTWDLKPDRTIVQHNPDIFYGVIGTYWHLEENTFALGYTSGGIAEFTCDGETMNAGAMICSRTPIID